MDDNAEKLGRKKMRSDAMKRQFAINGDVYLDRQYRKERTHRRGLTVVIVELPCNRLAFDPPSSKSTYANEITELQVTS